MRIVYHSNYFVWFEVARTELFRKYGLAYNRFEEQNLALAVVEANARYKSVARYDDLLELKAEVIKISPRRIVFAYEIHCADRLICEGGTTHFFIDLAQGCAVSAAKSQIWQEVKQALTI